MTRTKKSAKAPIGGRRFKSAQLGTDDRDMEAYIRRVLQAHTPQELSVPGRRLAAVLAPLYCRDGEYGLIFTKRTDTLYYHRGQISFPGGGYEPQDLSLQQ